MLFQQTNIAEKKDKMGNAICNKFDMRRSIADEQNKEIFNCDIDISIADVPNEVIQKYILVHLSSADVKAFSMTGCKRFKVIADDVLEKRRKATISIRMIVKVMSIIINFQYKYSN